MSKGSTCPSCNRPCPYCGKKPRRGGGYGIWRHDNEGAAINLPLRFSIYPALTEEDIKRKQEERLELELVPGSGFIFGLKKIRELDARKDSLSDVELKALAYAKSKYREGEL